VNGIFIVGTVADQVKTPSPLRSEVIQRQTALQAKLAALGPAELHLFQISEVPAAERTAPQAYCRKADGGPGASRRAAFIRAFYWLALTKSANEELGWLPSDGGNKQALPFVDFDLVGGVNLSDSSPG